jgi:putative restriction endonuclease
MRDLFVGVTDKVWFDNLSRIQPDEVNFWRPGGTSFQALKPGGLFFFKLHAPYNALAGFGVFVRYSVLPLRLAWEAFGEKNGVGSLAEFQHRISRYRRDNALNPMIGCIILAQPVFYPEAKWIAQPDSWANSIVQGKGYDSSTSDGTYVYRFAQEQLQSLGFEAPDVRIPAFAERMQKVRLGQGAFRIMVTDAYHRRCAISGERTLPVLEAAHIKPVAKQGPHNLQNGLLLRSDLHILLDEGYLTVTDDYHVEVSRRIKAEYENGKDYYRFHGERLMILPTRAEEKPLQDYLRWHNENVYCG